MLADARSLIIAATPVQKSELRTIFSEKSEGIRRKLESPPVLRESGWGLQTSDQARFVRGELIRVKSHRSAIDLYRDGTLIFSGHISSDYLAWSDTNDLDIHPLALVEVVVNFTRFYGLVLDDLQRLPERVLFTAEARNLHLEGKNNRLPSGPIGSDITWKFFATFLQAPEDHWTSAEIQVSSNPFDPDHVAYLLLRELYFWFGHGEEAIPYLKTDGGRTAVDADQIAGIGRRRR
jgi:hypothetical protein